MTNGQGPRNVSHIAIGVSDMEASLRFYRDVIGMTVATDRIEDFRRPGFVTKRRGVYLRWAVGDDASFLVLDETIDGDGDRGAAKQLFDIGVHHFGFWVNDVDAIVTRAEAGGFTVHMAPFDGDSGGYGEPGGRPMRVSLLRDPDGNVVQLDQRVDREGG